MMWGCNVRLHGTRGRNPIYRNIIGYMMLSLLYMMHMHSSTVNSSSSPISLFAPPHQVHLHHHSMAVGKNAQFEYRSSHRQSSLREPLLTNNNNGYKRRNARTMPKVKSPSNSYTQFYKEGVLVGIENTSPNSRRISGEIIMDISIDAIWNILTDYDNLSTHVPNLVESRVINNGGKIVGGRPRVYQRGAQRIFGFQFGADVTMDMTECILHSHSQEQYDNNEPKMYSIDFECVDSQFFSQFDGSWILEQYSNSKTMVRYIVDVRPKGPVPVAALEWRIKEDVPANIIAVSRSARAASARQIDTARVQSIETEQEVIEPAPAKAQQSSSRTPQFQLNPLRRLTDQAANNLKRTAKSVLPSPVFSTARRAIKAMDPNTMRRTLAGYSPSMTMSSGNNSNVKSGRSKRHTNNRKRNELSSRSSIVDWYEDETLAMYVNDS